jgi:hypothetical protein
MATYVQPTDLNATSDASNLIVTRLANAAPLTHTQVDANLNRIATKINLCIDGMDQLNADIGSNTASIATNASTIASLSMLDEAYPVGAIYISTVATLSAAISALGTWDPYGAGRVLVGHGTSTDSNGATQAFDAAGPDSNPEYKGGEIEHTLTENEIPAHTHTYIDRHILIDGQFDSDNSGNDADNMTNATRTTDPTGGGLAHNNLQPYLAVYMWVRST